MKKTGFGARLIYGRISYLLLCKKLVQYWDLQHQQHFIILDHMGQDFGGG